MSTLFLALLLQAAHGISKNNGEHQDHVEKKAEAEEKQLPNAGDIFNLFGGAWDPNCAVDESFYEKDLRSFLPEEYRHKFKRQAVSLVEETKTDNAIHPISQDKMSGVQFLTTPYEGTINDKVYQHKKFAEVAHSTEKSQLDELLKETLKMSQMGNPYKSFNKDLVTARKGLDDAHLQLIQDKGAVTDGWDLTPSDKFETWYVNMKAADARKECVTKQLAEVGQQAKRFGALAFPPKCLAQGVNPEECLKGEGYGDCVEHGVNYGAINTHGSKSNNARQTAFHVVSNWCGHKRLFKALEAKEDKNVEYFIILEDDVVIDRKWFMKVIQDFTHNYNGTEWDLLQLDPFGAKRHEDLVGHFRGKPIWKPNFNQNPGKEDSGEDPCRNYWGFQALVIRKDGLPALNAWMEAQPAIPFDWISRFYKKSLSFGALIARNPEERVYGRDIAVPSFCSNEIMESTIAANSFVQKSEPTEIAQSTFAASSFVQKTAAKKNQLIQMEHQLESASKMTESQQMDMYSKMGDFIVNILKKELGTTTKQVDSLDQKMHATALLQTDASSAAAMQKEMEKAERNKYWAKEGLETYEKLVTQMKDLKKAALEKELHPKKVEKLTLAQPKVTLKTKTAPTPAPKITIHMDEDEADEVMDA